MVPSSFLMRAEAVDLWKPLFVAAMSFAMDPDAANADGAVFRNFHSFRYDNRIRIEDLVKNRHSGKLLRLILVCRIGASW